MPAIDIDCYSLNFTKETHEFFDPLTQKQIRGPKILPMSREQQNAALALVDSYGAELDVETEQLRISIHDAWVYIDDGLRVDNEVVHFNHDRARTHLRHSSICVRLRRCEPTGSSYS